MNHAQRLHAVCYAQGARRCRVTIENGHLVRGVTLRRSDLPVQRANARRNRWALQAAIAVRRGRAEPLHSRPRTLEGILLPRMLWEAKLNLIPLRVYKTSWTVEG